MSSDNKTLARFILDGIPPAPRGMPQVEVTFDIDANGILNVSAKDKATNKSQSVKIEASTNLSKDEIEKLKKEAAEHASEDERKKELAEVRNQSESLIYTSEKALRDAGDKVPADLKKTITDKVDSLKKAKEGENVSEIRSALDTLSLEIQKIGQMVYNEGKGDKPEQPGQDAQSGTNS
jgi:molecular chaperone DnaK